ncbi:Sterol 3-beta-glucosyltransferase [Penicillium ucsense]|uniref:Sterol 3-beta-glucosyltransferase n=1 Tax=Penicillium ucsense TaxID=2839758 RepID=A0A8J8WAG3_9EURO|nr:Sterol 3-beta-glucosyltransferase [Penicillium ucsense]KAF7733903.1 Sterol 3-beta-glucosyltransferase [Penicillium ucsense]
MKPSSGRRLHSNRWPDRFQDGEDAQIDFTAPPTSMRSRDGQMQYMQQSLFSVLAAVGSRSDFRGRFDDSSDSDGGLENSSPDAVLNLNSNKKVTLGDRQSIEREDQDTKAQSEERGRRHQRTKPESKTPAWKSTLLNQETSDDPLSASCATLKFPTRRTRSATPGAAPILTRMIQAQQTFESAIEPGESPLRPSSPQDDSQEPPSSALSTRLMKMFGFDKPEKVLVEYACALLQSMLLQGYMYVTEGHICFYAYLPKKTLSATKSGFLSKRGRKNPKYNRYWFVLKGDVLTYYANPSNLYFPSGHIDLRYGISASLAEVKAQTSEATDFQVTTDQRTYHFRAESAASAKEWVKSLQQVIFRSRNEGDSVKISFPLENVIDMEESPMAEFAETFKIRVLDNNETYAIDEYFFTFFNSGQEAFDYLKSLVNVSSAKCLAGGSRQQRDGDQQSQANISQGTKALGQQGVGGSLSGPDSELRGSSDSLDNSTDQGMETLPIVQSFTETNESASQILNRSDVFQSPTMRSLPRRRSEVDDQRHKRAEDATQHSSNRQVGVARQESTDLRSFKTDTDDLHGVQGQGDSVTHPPSQTTPAISSSDSQRAGTQPLKRVAGIAGYLKIRSKQMSNLLATESMGYIEKVSGMWAGGQKHYDETEEVLPDDPSQDAEDKEHGLKHGDRFRAHFGLPSTEHLQATYYAYLTRVLPLYGKIYVSERKICFRSLLPGTRTKMILPLKDVENVEKEKGFRFGYHGLVIIVRGHEELFFEFSTADGRDDCAVTLHQNLESVKYLAESGILAAEEHDLTEAARAEHRMLQEARNDNPDEESTGTGRSVSESEVSPFFDDPLASIINFKPSESLKITCLTIGSRGDVQPYIALCKGLLAEGHRPKIATHAEFEPWIRSHGIDFALVDGDPAELMRICVENGMFTYSFLREATSKFRGWIDDLLSSSWASCQGSDVLIESPSAMAGIHIAEALRIPYFRGFTMPWSRTRAYPHAFAVPEARMGGAYNYITYVMFDNLFWKAIAGQVNRWRNNELGLKSTTLDKMQQNKVPFLYNYSPSVVPPPLDYPDWIRITGYWFLNEGADWAPPAELAAFIKRARADGKKLVYIGFGSIVVSDPAALTRTVVESVQKADIRCILSKGWSDRLGDPSSQKAEIPLPSDIFQIQSAPHDWLFSQIDAAAHHGGAGTTGASLRAGVPTIIKPFFGDQFFFGSRVEDLGVGICMKKLNVSVFSRALWEATHSERMIVKARELGIQIRSENGVATAIQSLYRDMEYAKTLARQRSLASSTPFSPTPSAQASPDHADADVDDIEEWTFVGEEAEMDLNKRMQDLSPSEREKIFSGIIR